MQNKKISVIIPFYNGVEWLCEAVQSVLRQTYKNFEIIVINDGSSENMDRFLNKFGDKTHYIVTNNKGPGPARNLGIEMAKGEYIAFLDSDDLWLPNKLEVQVLNMNNYNWIWSHTSYSLFNDENTEFIKDVLVGDFKGDIFLKKFISSPIATPCVIIKKVFFDENPNIRFSESLRFGQDAYLWGCISEMYPLGALNDVLSKVRIRGSNAGIRARVQIQARANTCIEIIKRRGENDVKFINFPKFPFFLFRLAFSMNKLLCFLEKKFNLESETAELMSKVLYAPIYLGFKTYNLILK